MTLTQRGSGPYGLDRPTLNDVRAAIERVHLTEAELVWGGLLAGAGLTGEETDRPPSTCLSPRCWPATR
jgi:hypothetical protein